MLALQPGIQDGDVGIMTGIVASGPQEVEGSMPSAATFEVSCLDGELERLVEGRVEAVGLDGRRELLGVGSEAHLKRIRTQIREHSHSSGPHRCCSMASFEELHLF